MKSKIILVVLALTILFMPNILIAEGIHLCLNDSEQYAVIVNSKDDCLENEGWIEISGGNDLETKKKYTPLLNVSSNEQCKTQGLTRKVGFDENNNGSLDQNEIISTESDCKIADEEES